MSVRIICGDMLVELPKLEADSVDACCTDPPYHLTNNTGRRSPNPGQYTPIGKPKAPRGGFMGKQWDGGDIALRPETWEAVWRVLKPGAHLLAFGGTRTFHRMVCAIEDAGFEIRDTIAWMYGSGFPKSLDASKAIDRAAGVEREIVSERPAFGIGGNGCLGGHADGAVMKTTAGPATPEAAQWSGWGTALKPAMELICVARKPLAAKTVAGNVLKYGTGALNIDACRIEAAQGDEPMKWETPRGGIWKTDNATTADIAPSPLGRFPANVCHDGSDEVLAAFPVVHGAGAAREEPGGAYPASDNGWGHIGKGQKGFRIGDEGSAARFFYSAKADSSDRQGSKHPTVKPTDLMRWLVKLITPPGGTVIDPFCGTGSTLLAADQLQLNAIGIEQDATYAEDARRKFTRDAGLFSSLATQ